MTSHTNLSINKHPLPTDAPRSVQLPNGDSTLITHTGSSNMTSQYIITNVHLIPGFKFSLLSVSKITKDLQCAVCLYLNFVTIQDLSSGQVKVIGREQAGLYLIPQSSSLIFYR